MLPALQTAALALTHTGERMSDHGPDPYETRLPREAVAEALSTYGAIIDNNRNLLSSAAQHAVDGQTEFTKTMMTLSSSALVLSISIVQLMAARMASAHFAVLLPIAWILFGIIIVLVGFRTIWLQHAQSFDVNYASARADLESKVRSLPTPSELTSFIDEHIAPQFDAAARTVVFHTKLDRSQTASVWMFTIGMIALLAFAIANLPR